MPDTMRERFTTLVPELMDRNPRLALVLADIGAGYFRDTGLIGRHPGRVFNMGIREQLMVSFAAGLALEGLRPLVHTFGAFLVERPFEQVKLDFSHQDVGGLFVSAYGSYDWAAGGRTHQSPGDVALMATLPDWRIHVPGHADEAEHALRLEADRVDSAYVRLSEEANRDPVELPPGGMTLVRQGSNRGAPAVIGVGPVLSRVLEATADMDVTVVYVVTVRPLDRRVLTTAVSGSDVILVEPYLEGTSLGAVASALGDTPRRLHAIGVPNVELRKYGTFLEHQAAHGLDTVGIRGQIEAFLRPR